MTTFIVSQGERWHRIYKIDADSLEEAKAKYEESARKGVWNGDVRDSDPVYVEDILDDQLWSEGGRNDQ